MIDKLNTEIRYLDNYLRDVRKWDSLVINKRVPHTYRVFRMLDDGSRLCLHKFEYFDKDGGDEAFMHPHPWPGAFQIMGGEYEMKLGYTENREQKEPKIICTTRMREGSSYEITDPLTWHSVTPRTKVVYSIMLNGKPWDADVAHTAVRTTKGKDLQKMTKMELANHLSYFANKLCCGDTWTCEDSPTGFCVQMEHSRYDHDCKYCGNPMDERK